jgi:tetratricopeptide (TPR) repeat protein
VKKWFLLILLSSCAARGQSYLDIQVSDLQHNPVKAMKITAKQASSTVVTDDAGKGRLSFSTSATILDLMILEPKDLDFANPWTDQVSIPPNMWPLLVIKKADKDALQRKPIIRALAARTNLARAPRKAGQPGLSRAEAVRKVAARFDINPDDLNRSFDAVLGKSDDPYDRGQLALLNGDSETAAKLFEKALSGVDTEKRDSESIERGFSSALFLGQSLSESGKYDDAAAAYQKALVYRPNDPMIFNSIGITFTKAGKNDTAQMYFRESNDARPQTAARRSLTTAVSGLTWSALMNGWAMST